MPGRDTKTRYPGIYARHQEHCHCSKHKKADPKDCNCKPSYYGKAYDKRARRTRSTARFTKISEARTAHADLAARIRQGMPVVSDTGLTVRDACDRFVLACRDGIALNKHRRRFKPRAVDELKFALAHLKNLYGDRRIAGITRGDIQRLADDMTSKGLSGSTVRSAINGARSLWRWLINREMAIADPASGVELPAIDETPRDRVVSPLEFETMLSLLKLDDQVPYALAGYAGGRHHEIQMLDWTDISFELNAIEFGVSDQARKSKAARRIVPGVKPLMVLLRRHWMAQGRPSSGKVCQPIRVEKSGLKNLSTVVARARRIWGKAEIEPLGLHEARHTFLTWLDHAGVSPKVSSVLGGHSAARHQPGAAPITLRRYTHVLDGELERARDQLAAFIAERTQSERASGNG